MKKLICMILAVFLLVSLAACQDAREDDYVLATNALESGSFPFRIEVKSVYDVDPTLGKDNVANGVRAGIYGMIAVVAFMVAYYLIAGVVAVIALAVVAVIVVVLYTLEHYGVFTASQLFSTKSPIMGGLFDVCDLTVRPLLEKVTAFFA
jgi:hypothetical protein